MLFVVASLGISLSYRQSHLAGSIGKANGLTYIDLPRYFVITCQAISIVTLALHARDTLSSFSVLGVSGDWNESMNAYRGEMAFRGDVEGAGTSGLSNALFKILTPIAFVLMYVYINNLFVSKRNAKAWYLILPAGVYLACELLTGVRLGAIRMVCAAIVVAWVLWAQTSGWRKRLKLAAFVKGAVLVVAACVLFWVAAWLVGRQVELGIIDYICSYIGYSFISFDLFLNDVHAQSAVFGQETFRAIYDSLGRMFGDSFISQTGGNEFRVLDGISLGNVYTIFRTWYSDFGLWGMLTVSAICGIAFTVLYERARLKDPKWSIRFSLVGYSYFAAGFFAMPLVSLLSQTALQFTAPFELVLIYLLIRVIDGIGDEKPLLNSGVKRTHPAAGSYSRYARDF